MIGYLSRVTEIDCCQLANNIALIMWIKLFGETWRKLIFWGFLFIGDRNFLSKGLYEWN